MHILLRYKILNFKLSQRTEATSANCIKILRNAALHDWAMGHTKVNNINVLCMDLSFSFVGISQIFPY